ncbi:hypothetical protein ASD52_01900 [Ensifer sp. Root142]|nr:hypothetical protein ASD52_01900 [Ensifer sp. Root142]
MIAREEEPRSIQDGAKAGAKIAKDDLGQFVVSNFQEFVFSERVTALRDEASDLLAYLAPEKDAEECEATDAGDKKSGGHDSTSSNIGRPEGMSPKMEKADEISQSGLPRRRAAPIPAILPALRSWAAVFFPMNFRPLRRPYS